MKTLKTMGIIGLVIAGLSWICTIAYNNRIDYETAIGWGAISMFYLITFSIVTIVKSRHLQ